MKKLALLLLAIPIAFAIYWLKTPQQPQDGGNVVKAAPMMPSANQKAITQPETKPEPPKPARWAIQTSPHSVASVEKINIALATYQDLGLSKVGAAYLAGNFISESFLDETNCRGDSGTACGLGQWRFGRQQGMPAGYVDQLKWAVETEMPRDARGNGYQCLCDALRTDDVSLIKNRMKQWERWGVEGARWHYAQAIYSQL